jgi:glycosyltransferase involved in cell wall biosynthesis
LHKDGGFRVLQIFKKLNFNSIYYDTRLSKSFIPPLIYKIYLDFFFLFKVKKKTKIVYLSGTPPIVSINAFIFCCFQNENIFSKKNNSFKLKRFVSKDFYRYIFFKIFKKNVDLWLVFSPVAKKLLLNESIPEYKIKMVYLFDKNNNKNIKIKYKKKYDFIYPAALMEHKNHQNLIKALIILSKKKIYPKVLLTLNPNEVKSSGLLQIIKKFKLNIKFKHYKYNKMRRAYNSSRALIFPSLNETIALPILEAAYNNLTILASNKEYATQFLIPEILFEPTNPNDIAKKIKLFLGSNNMILRNKITKVRDHDFIDLNIAKKIFL